MKKTITWILLFSLCFCLFIGCSNQATGEGKEITETTSVLYVEKDGFIAQLSGHVCYVEYANSDSLVAVGDQIELTYVESDLLVVINDRKLGDYQWDAVLVKCSALTVE